MYYDAEVSIVGPQRKLYTWVLKRAALSDTGKSIVRSVKM